MDYDNGNFKKVAGGWQALMVNSADSSRSERAVLEVDELVAIFKVLTPRVVNRVLDQCHAFDNKLLLEITQHEADGHTDFYLLSNFENILGVMRYSQ